MYEGHSWAAGKVGTVRMVKKAGTVSPYSMQHGNLMAWINFELPHVLPNEGSKPLMSMEKLGSLLEEYTSNVLGVHS